MNRKPPERKILIVGGGSAGWMTAAYLQKTLNHHSNIVLVESPTVGTIGVGEATFSTIHLFFEFLGLEEQDWMPECNATYKLAIKFVDWNEERRHFFHPFQRYETVAGRTLAEWWLKLLRDRQPFDYSSFLVPALCDRQRSPRFMNGEMFDRCFQAHLDSKDTSGAVTLENLNLQYPYAYHFDASRVAAFLSSYAQKLGVECIKDDVTEVRVTESNFIRSIQTREHGEIVADLFIDCTGFRGLLINQTLNEPFIPFAASLPCDSAIATQVPTDSERDGINPFTTASALSAGWVWNIPLFERCGTGYVYSSAFISKEEAEREFRRHLGPFSDRCRASHIKMRVGRNRNSWVNNCVAIGLSSGFVEPLESTGLFFIQHGIDQLVQYLPGPVIESENVRSYNRTVGDCIDGIRDFLTLHYFASSRMDTEFWKATKHDLAVSDDVRERLELWKRRLPTARTINPSYHGFEAYSYIVMMLGLGTRPKTSLPILEVMDDTEAFESFRRIQERAAFLAESLPSQYDYLHYLYGKTAAPPNNMLRQRHPTGR
jgi:glycine/D-amino acid oxidase-like deaminating enzyme